jgi:hypothetical protein
MMTVGPNHFDNVNTLYGKNIFIQMKQTRSPKSCSIQFVSGHTSEKWRLLILPMIVILAALVSADPTTPPVAFKGVWKFGLNLPSLAIVVGLSLVLMGAVYLCERRHAAQNAPNADAVPPVFPARYQMPGAPLATFTPV